MSNTIEEAYQYIASGDLQSASETLQVMLKGDDPLQAAAAYELHQAILDGSITREWGPSWRAAA